MSIKKLILEAYNSAAIDGVEAVRDIVKKIPAKYNAIMIVDLHMVLDQVQEAYRKDGTLEQEGTLDGQPTPS